MTKEEAWLMWMNESNRYVEYDWDMIKKSSHWQAFSRGWDAASVNVNGWDDAYKMGMEAGKELEQHEWQGLTDEEVGMLTVFDGLHHVEVPLLAEFIRAIEAKLKEKNT
jgi:hypothetical protein